MAIVSGYDERLRNQQSGAAVKDDCFEKYRRVVDIKHGTWCDARSEFLPDSGGDVQFRGRAQPVSASAIRTIRNAMSYDSSMVNDSSGGPLVMSCFGLSLSGAIRSPSSLGKSRLLAGPAGHSSAGQLGPQVGTSGQCCAFSASTCRS